MIRDRIRAMTFKLRLRLGSSSGLGSRLGLD